MIPWELLDRASVSGGGELRLMRRGSEYSIMAGTTELMNSRLSGSEEALASLPAERLGARPDALWLIGGLGMGFTLRAALAVLPETARITVAELVPEVIAWARGPMAPIFGDSLTDPRVSIEQADVARLLRGSQALYDAILLDVDNGPDGLTRQANDGLYSAAGLKAARTVLRPGGILAVWSSSPDAAFTRRLGQGGFVVEEVTARARGKRGGARHTIWLASKPA